MNLFAYASIDYGYPWWLSYGHLPILAAAIVLLLAGFFRKWRVWPMLLIGVVAVWAAAAFLVDRFVIDVNGRPTLPTERFLASGTGRVLDIGAGTGRSSIMVLEARPHTTLVASDLFSESFDQHFGRRGSPQQRLLGNLKAAGVERRATIITGDMVKLSFQAAPAARVLKPGGEFLLMVVAQEPCSPFAFGPLLKHGGARGPGWWPEHVQAAGFQVIEHGTRPLTLYVLARRL